jgi:hypothetical protein
MPPIQQRLSIDSNRNNMRPSVDSYKIVQREAAPSNMAITEQMGEASSSDEDTRPMLITKSNALMTDTNAMTLFEDF